MSYKSFSTALNLGVNTTQCSGKQRAPPSEHRPRAGRHTGRAVPAPAPAATLWCPRGVSDGTLSPPPLPKQSPERCGSPAGAGPAHPGGCIWRTQRYWKGSGAPLPSVSTQNRLCGQRCVTCGTFLKHRKWQNPLPWSFASVLKWTDINITFTSKTSGSSKAKHAAPPRFPKTMGIQLQTGKNTNHNVRELLQQQKAIIKKITKAIISDTKYLIFIFFFFRIQGRDFPSQQHCWWNRVRLSNKGVLRNFIYIMTLTIAKAKLAFHCANKPFPAKRRKGLAVFSSQCSPFTLF